MAINMTRRTSNANCAPVPTTAERRTRLHGGLNTSPCTSFQPDSSFTSRSCNHQYQCQKWFYNLKNKENSVGQTAKRVTPANQILKLGQIKVEETYQALEIIIFTSILCIIISESPHQYHWDQTSEKNNHHERVEDGEPMDLQNEKRKT